MSNNVSKYNRFGFVDPFFDDFFNENKSSMNQMMKTDIKDNGDHYEFKIDLPEVKKENIHLSLEDGYLTIEVKTSHEENTNEKNHYIRRERIHGNFSRSYYVGDEVKEEDIKAKLDAGVLTLNVKKVELITREKKYIDIE